MTDARFPDRWLSDKRIQRLSDANFRGFIHALAWSATNRSDGVIEPEDLDLIPRFPKDAVKAFIGAELWVPRGAEGRGWLFVDFASTQTTALQLKAAENARAREREKKARQRASGKAATSADGVVPRDIPRDVGGDNTGKDRQGKDRQGLEGDQLPVAAGAENQPWPPPWHGPGPNPYVEYK